MLAVPVPVQFLHEPLQNALLRSVPQAEVGDDVGGERPKRLESLEAVFPQRVGRLLGQAVLGAPPRRDVRYATTDSHRSIIL